MLINSSAHDARSAEARARARAHHVHALGVDVLGEHAARVRDEVDELVERRALHLFALQVRQRVHQEVEQHAALLQLTHEQRVALLAGRRVLRAAHSTQPRVA